VPTTRIAAGRIAGPPPTPPLLVMPWLPLPAAAAADGRRTPPLAAGAKRTAGNERPRRRLTASPASDAGRA
jgi:hypothetical protein